MIAFPWRLEYGVCQTRPLENSTALDLTAKKNTGFIAGVLTVSHRSRSNVRPISVHYYRL